MATSLDANHNFEKASAHTLVDENKFHTKSSSSSKNESSASEQDADPIYEIPLDTDHDLQPAKDEKRIGTTFAEDSSDHSPSRKPDAEVDVLQSTPSASGNPAPQRPTTLQRGESQAEVLSTKRIVVIMFSLAMALFVAALDVTIITTALPTIAIYFNASAAEYTWVGSSYLLACAATVPLWGKFSDIWGRKPVLVIANVIFLIGSLIAALSVTIGMLIAGRTVQGLGGGGLVVLINIVIGDLFSMRERAKYYGMIGMVWAIASGVGPVIGGLFTEKVTWRWCFYVNLPLDGVSLTLLIFFLKLDTPKTPFMAGVRTIDWIGVVTIVGGIIMFLYGLESGGVTHPWASAFVLCLIIFGLVSIGLFWVNEWKLAKYPITPLRILNDRSNAAALITTFVQGFTFVAGSYYLPLYFQTVLGATPILSGVYLLIYVVALSVMSALVGIYIRKTGRYRPPIWFGMFFMTLGFGCFIDLGTEINWAKLAIFQLIAGIGVGPLFQAPLIAIQSHVKRHDMASATALFGMVRQIATSMSIVLGGVLFQNQLAKQQSTLVRALGPELAQRFTGANFGSSIELLGTLRPAQRAALNNAYVSALQDMWIFYTAFSGFGLLVSFFIKKKELTKDHAKARTGIAEQERVRLEEKAERTRKRSEADALRTARKSAEMDNKKSIEMAEV